MIEIFNEDCLYTMNNRLAEKSVDIVITSPPYNNSRTCHSDYCMKTSNCRYSEYNDNKPNGEYCKWICDIFDGYDRIVKNNGTVLFNISYGSENPSVMFECISDIIHFTNWMVADVISWKKKSALPNNVSSNKCTRICEFVFVFCRKNEYDTYVANKPVTSHSRTGQPFYSVIYNFIEADNNDGTNPLNKATFSSDLVAQLLDMYSPNSDATVYDSFMGTGTTAFVCQKRGLNCYGSELSSAQCDYANNRLAFDGAIPNHSNECNGYKKVDWFEEFS